jgi:hypothetical protein
MSDNEEKNTDNVSEESSDIRSAEADQTADIPQTTGSGSGNSALFAIIAVLILIGGLVFYFATRKPTAKMATMLEILPQESLVLSTVDFGKIEDREVKNNLWNKIKEMETFKQAISEFESTEKINLEEDILSWIGESFTVSVFPVSSDTSENNKNTDPSFAVLVSVRDLTTAKTKVPELIEKSGTKYTEETYEGIKIMVPEKKDAPTLSFYREMLLIGNSAADIKKCIDAGKGKTKALKNNDKATSSLNKLPPNSVITFYIDLEKLISEGPGAEDIKKNPEIDKFVKSLNGLAIGMGIRKNGDLTGTGFVGIKKQTESAIAKALLETRTDVGIPSTAKLFPKDTTQYAVFDVKYLYGIMTKLAEAQDGGKEQFDMAKELMKTQIGIDLDKDIFDNLAGEAAYSLNMMDMVQHQLQAAMSTKNSKTGMTAEQQKKAENENQQAPVVIAIKLKDKAKIQEVIDTLLSKSEGLVSSLDYSDVKLYMLPEEAGGFGIYEDFFLIGMGKGVDRIKAIIDNKMDESKSLASLDSFREIQGKLNKNTLTVGFINVESVIPMMEMALILSSVQKGNGQQQFAREMLAIAKQYTNVWTYSEIESGGIKFDFTAMQDKKTSK